MHPEVCVRMCVCVRRASPRVAGDARAHAGQVLQGVDQPAAPTGQAHSHGARSRVVVARHLSERSRARRAGRPPREPDADPTPHHDPPQDLTTDFGDGIKLIKLVENISEETLGKYHKAPKSRIQMIENINLPIKYINGFVASIGIKNTYSAENIIDQDKQFILGMVRARGVQGGGRGTGGGKGRGRGSTRTSSSSPAWHAPWVFGVGVG